MYIIDIIIYTFMIMKEKILWNCYNGLKIGYMMKEWILLEIFMKKSIINYKRLAKVFLIDMKNMSILKTFWINIKIHFNNTKKNKIKFKKKWMIKNSKRFKNLSNLLRLMLKSLEIYKMILQKKFVIILIIIKLMNLFRKTLII